MSKKVLDKIIYFWLISMEWESHRVSHEGLCSLSFTSLGLQMNQLIRCIDCDSIFIKTPFDRCPEFTCDPGDPSETVRSTDRDDYQSFLSVHHGHRLDHPEILEDSFISEKAYIEPVKVSYYRAANKTERFVVKRFRESIEEPLRFRLIPGEYTLECIGIEIQSEEIVRQLKSDFRRSPLSQDQISAFLKLHRRIVDRIDIRNLVRIPEESSHPLEIFYKMDDVSVFYLLRNCRNIVRREAYPQIEQFIYRHKDDGVLLLKARHRIQSTERAKAKGEAASTVASVRDTKAMERERG